MSNNNIYAAGMRDPLHDLPGYSLRRAANASAAELAGRLSAFDLRQSDVSVLLLIAANPEVTASALGRHLDIQRANMVPLLKRLEDRGLIDRLALDGKSQGLVLTGEGAALTDQAREVIRTFEQELLARVPALHRDHLLPALDALWH